MSSDRSITSAPTPDLILEVEKGDFVFREGDLGTDMYVLHDGEIEILREMNGELRQIAVLEKGDFFGEMSLLEELPRNASARALSGVKVIEINRAMFDRMLRGNPEIGVRIMRKLSRRVRETDELLKDVLSSGQQAPARKQPESPPTAQMGPPFPCLLVHRASGIRFELDVSHEVTVGRADPVTGIEPDVDLSEVDTERSSSRRHAKMYLEGDQVMLVEEIGTLNGTFINSTRLQTAVPGPLSSGDTVRFGLVEFSFKITG